LKDFAVIFAETEFISLEILSKFLEIQFISLEIAGKNQDRWDIKKIEKPVVLVKVKTRQIATDNVNTKEGAPIEYGSVVSPLNTLPFSTKISDIEKYITAHYKLLQDVNQSKNKIGG